MLVICSPLSCIVNDQIRGSMKYPSLILHLVDSPPSPPPCNTSLGTGTLQSAPSPGSSWPAPSRTTRSSAWSRSSRWGHGPCDGNSKSRSKRSRVGARTIRKRRQPGVRSSLSYLGLLGSDCLPSPKWSWRERSRLPWFIKEEDTTTTLQTNIFIGVFKICFYSMWRYSILDG